VKEKRPDFRRLQLTLRQRRTVSYHAGATKNEALLVFSFAFPDASVHPSMPRGRSKIVDKKYARATIETQQSHVCRSRLHADGQSRSR